ncbi:MAG: histidine-type phosphatase, partial [Prevotella sp.]|nr:histidine-type phosphatase [Prevotella sp.]
EKHDRVMNLLFNDENYWKNEVNAENLNYHLFKLACNLQSTELRHTMTLYDLFTEEELYENWLQTNAWWYINYGPYPLNGGVAPFSQRNLLRVMIQEADSCLKFSHPGATLRYGHEVCVMPLACLLEMNNYGKPYADLEQLAMEGWNNYDIFPMGCNVQLIFYKPKKGTGDILVKALLNENETTLPLKAVSGPYYKWNDFRDYFMRKLNNYVE